MNYVVCSIRDRAADSFSAPFFAVSVGSAIRSFGDAINAKESSNFTQHPGDFDLFHLGTFNDHHATFELLNHPVQIAIGKDTVRAASGA